MEAATEVVVDTSCGHRIKSLFDHAQGLIVAGAVPVRKQHRQIRRLGKLRRTAETSVDGIECAPESVEGFGQSLR